MKIKVIGKAHLKGASKKTGNSCDLIQVHYSGKAHGVDGTAALTLSLDLRNYLIRMVKNAGADPRPAPAPSKLHLCVHSSLTHPVPPHSGHTTRCGVLPPQYGRRGSSSGDTWGPR